jgi:SAM-dependent methyltransferase
MPSLLWPRPELCSALDPAADARLRELHDALERFYNSAIARTYFAMAEAENETWGPERTSHWHLVHAIPAGATVLDLGCGSAHLCRHLAGRHVRYTGIDWSREQVERNRTRYPGAEFVASSLYEPRLDGRQFDVVTSLYVIEHLVWPHRLLDQMHARTTPGGLIGILTPPFRERAYLKSFDYGLSARPFGQKVRRLSVLDALVHVYHHRLAYPLLLRRRFPRGHGRGRFLIHLRPVCLNGGPYFPDSDAVYMADTREIAAYVEALGATVIVHWPKAGYVLLRKTPAA